MTHLLRGKTFWLVMVGVVAVLALAAGYGRPVSAESGSSSYTGIWVSAEGTASGTPDLAIVNLGVEVLADSAADARTKAAEGIANVIAAVKEHSIADDDIQTRYYNISPRYNYVETIQCVNDEGEVVEPGLTGTMPPGTECTRSHKQVLEGYQVSNQLAVKVRDLESVGAIIDGVVEATGDIVRINGINFSIEDSQALEDKAREAAVANLKAKAGRLAALAGLELGQLVYISESAGPAPFQQSGGFAFAALDTAALTSIQPGQLEVVVRVQGGFKIAGFTAIR